MRLARTCWVVLGLAACGDSAEVPIDAGVDASTEPVPQGSPATSDLAINEIAPRGDGPDWIELVNRSAAEVDLCDYFLTDAVDRLDHYLPLGGVMPGSECPPRRLAPGGYLVIDADGGPVVEEPINTSHAPFGLGVADEVHLVTLDGRSVDGLLYLYPPGPNAPATVTLSRIPDGDGPFLPAPPSRGAANPEVAP